MYQYFRPGGRFFVGDCMPFAHDGVFHAVYLLDEEHHGKGDGLGYHQWAQATTTDLVHWQEQPLLLPISNEWECSICTGSVFWHEGTYYAFYAQRLRNHHQQLCVATSSDGRHFRKHEGNPLAVPPAGYSPLHFRDPFVFLHEGLFHMIISAELEPYPVAGRGGCLAHLTSTDLYHWEMQPAPFLHPGYACVPECADYFEWNGWYYLVFGTSLATRYRLSREPLGPWLAPPCDVFEGPQAAVMKTAPFGENRRLGMAHLLSADEAHRDGSRVWGGNVAFRELVQNPDGTLGLGFVPELAPESAGRLKLGPSTEGEGTGRLRAGGLALVALGEAPADLRLTARLAPTPGSGPYGLALHTTADYAHGYEVRLTPAAATVEIRPVEAAPLASPAPNALFGVPALDRPVALEIICRGDILDLCVNGRHCLVARVPAPAGPHLFAFCHDGVLEVEALTVEALRPGRWHRAKCP